MMILPNAIRAIAGTAAALAVLTCVTTAHAQTVRADRCTAAKIRCVMGYTHVCGVAGVMGLFKCHQTATLKSRFVDQVCVNRTEDEIIDCFRLAERRNVCRTLGDVAAVQTRIEAFVVDGVEDVTPGYPFPLTNRCAAGKQQTIAEGTFAKLECFEDAFRRGGAVEAGCFAKAEAQFDYAWAKLEARGDCLSTGGEDTLEDKIDAFVAEMVVALDP